jgi:membrane protease YdiL (CAAX protease family)
MTILLKKNQTEMMQGNDPLVLTQEKNQYNLWQILTIWLTGSALMWIMGWVIYPALSRNVPVVEAGLLRMKLLTVGLIWQFVLSMIILYLEEGNLRLATIRRRFWLNTPISPKSGQKNNGLWWMLIPFLLLLILLEFAAAPFLNGLWVRLFPFLTEPPGYSGAALFAPELRTRWIGAWDLLALQVVLSIFNTFLGEEFLFHGLLLPKMNGLFGKRDWIMNGILFGLYHLHQPWGLPGNILSGWLLAYSAKRYRSNWFPILIHSGQSIFFIVIILGLVLGLA